jgi:hypothetical protein
MNEGSDRLIVRVPLTLKRRGGRTEVIVPEGLDPWSAEQPRTNRPIALAVARAHRWQELLDVGRFPSARALAAAVGVHHSYVDRLLRLTLLAPDIVEAIMAGREPSGLSLDKLCQLPMEWAEQRRML